MITLLRTLTHHTPGCWILIGLIIIQMKLQIKCSVNEIPGLKLGEFDTASFISRRRRRLKSRQGETKINSEQCVTTTSVFNHRFVGDWRKTHKTSGTEWSYSESQRHKSDHGSREREYTQKIRPSHGNPEAWAEKYFLVTAKHIVVYLYALAC